MMGTQASTCLRNRGNLNRDGQTDPVAVSVDVEG